MKLQRDSLLGLVFFAGLALVGWATLNVTTLSLAQPEKFVVYFDNAQGLREGDPVFVLGTRYGEVAEVVLSEDRERPPIRVEMKLARPLPPLTASRRIEIRQANLLGGSKIEIDPGTEGGPAPTPPFAGEARLNAIDALGEADLIGTIESIKKLFDRLADPDGSVGALLSSRQLYDDLAATIGSVRRSVEEVEQGKGPLGQLIYGRELGADINSAVVNLRELLVKANTGEGVVARLLNDPAIAEDVAAVAADTRQITGSLRGTEGTLGRLLNDPELADEMDATFASVRSAAGKLDDPNAGLLGAVLADPELRESGRDLVANLAEASTKINSGRGVIGRLLNDEGMAEQLDRVLRQVAGAIEDAREAAPVGTFFQVLSAPF